MVQILLPNSSHRDLEPQETDMHDTPGINAGGLPLYPRAGLHHRQWHLEKSVNNA